MDDYKDLCGWIDFPDRTPEQTDTHDAIVAGMPMFAIDGNSSGDDVDSVILTQLWTHSDVVAAIGFAYPGVWQRTGSCVGATLGNVIFTLSAVEVIRLGDAEQILVPFWLYPYGKSRQRGGMRGQGEGSFGSTGAEALKEDGVLQATYPGLPSFQNQDGLTWGRDAELKWSDGAAAPREIVEAAKKHLVGTVSPARSSSDVKAAIKNLYPISCAYRQFVSPNNARVQDGVCLGRLDSSGGHQTSILGWMKHARLGDLFLYVNQWQGVYPQCPTGIPRCATWITASDMDRICSEGETYAFSQFSGFPAQSPKILNWIP